MAVLLRPVRLWARRVRARQVRWALLARGLGALAGGALALPALPWPVQLLGLALVGGAVTYPLWTAPHHGDPDALRFRRRHRRIGLRAACLLLFAAVAVPLAGGPVAVSLVLALGALTLPALEPLVWRLWPEPLRAAVRRALAAEQYLEAMIGPGVPPPRRSRAGVSPGGVEVRPVDTVGTVGTVGRARRRLTRATPGRALVVAPMSTRVAFDPDAGFAGRPPALPARLGRGHKPDRNRFNCRCGDRLLRWTTATQELRLYHPTGQLVLPTVGAPPPPGSVPEVLRAHPVAELVLYLELRPREPARESVRLAFLDAEGLRLFELSAWTSRWSDVARLAAAAGLAFARYQLPTVTKWELPGRSGLVSDALFPWRAAAWRATRSWRPGE
ncbi:hypothetical protein [Streptacidiphilus anmyonensis]|uniref:hypothetical protein n=1 Tax=Streptacidiphilus anmyonensis TaxID=405782 RepID=UPI00128C5F61|nr:hypothetical protein [Streptacidiphilus anmyonensis]